MQFLFWKQKVVSGTYDLNYMEIHIHILDLLVAKGRICNTLEKIGIVFEPSKWVEAEICFINCQH